MKMIFEHEEIKKVFEVYLKEALVKYDNCFVVDHVLLDDDEKTIEITVSEKPEEETED